MGRIGTAVIRRFQSFGCKVAGYDPYVANGIEKALAHPGVNLHLYGKAQTKPFRKMGHATIVNDSLNEAKTIAKKVQEDLKIIA